MLLTHWLMHRRAMTTKTTEAPETPETPAQVSCPYCHPNEDGKVAILGVANGWLLIDPESSQLINREDYDNDMESDYSMSNHINYCYMCGRRLNGE